MNHSPAPLQPLLSASIIIVRESQRSSGIDVLLMERNAQTSSFGGTLVFPGGKVDANDELIAQSGGVTSSPLAEVFGISAQQAQSLYGAALRETVEEAGVVWIDKSLTPEAPRTGNLGQQLRMALQQGQNWSQACHDMRIVPATAPLLPWSRWITPTTPNMSSKRFDTFFFLAPMPEHEVAQADGHEAATLQWDTPRRFLSRFAEGEILLAPPQIMTLAHLSRFAGLGDLFEHAHSHRPYCMAPITREENGRRMVCFAGDELHEQGQAAMPGPSRLVMQDKRFMPPGGLESLFN